MRKRGDLVTIAVSGDYGKPRPALILQADAFDEHPSVTVLPLTQEIHPTPLFRVTVQPGRETGLRRVSQVMDDKATTVPQAKIGARMGCVDAATMQTISKTVIGFFGIVRVGTSLPGPRIRTWGTQILILSPLKPTEGLGGPPCLGARSARAWGAWMRRRCRRSARQ
ncbi:MAG: type II toxin-antitoxin system PemK/MazF family toxin [Acidobacteriaceae bacterium]